MRSLVESTSKFGMGYLMCPMDIWKNEMQKTLSQKKMQKIWCGKVQQKNICEKMAPNLVPGLFHWWILCSFAAEHQACVRGRSSAK